MPPIRISGVNLNGDLILGKGDNFTILTNLRSERNTNWNYVIKHEWTSSWIDDASAQKYFDDGGEIRLSGESANSRLGLAQDIEWAEMLSNMGMVIFNKKQTFSTGLGLGAKVGFESLTTTYQDIFRLESSLVYKSYNYGLLEYVVQAKLDNNRTIHMQALFTSQEINNADYVHFVGSKNKEGNTSPIFSTITELSFGGGIT